MNRAYDYNGVKVAPSRPVQRLVRRTRVLHISSADRDVTFYPTNGCFILYLPRTYERVVSVNIKDAEFPAITEGASWDFTGTPVGKYPGAVGANPLSTDTAQPNYFFMEIRSLNMSDETAAGADRAAFTNSVFAKFVYQSHTEPLIYNESSSAHQHIEYYPALTKVDRFEIKLRTHTMNSNQFLHWPGYDWSMSIDIETLENAFDDYSSMETRIAERA